MPTATLPKFMNVPILDFSDPEDRKKMESAIEKMKLEMGKEYPIIIGGEEVFLDKKFGSYNPSHKHEVVGIFQKADEETAEKAMQSALKAFETWKFTPAEERAKYLLKVSELMKEKRFELDAVMILEEGKNWIEADADLCEAIDFLEYYARQIMEIDKGVPLTEYEPEENKAAYIPLGVGIVIPPWNFPSAILTGMISSALAAGNTVILKPASDAPWIATKVMELFREAGIPPGVLNLVTGPGSVAGNYLVEHPKTRFISFTGSMEVGKGIYEKASKVMPGQIWLKRTVIEMGGKDAIIVDSETDITNSADGVAVSACGFQGQKCSACSRCIVVEDVYDEFVEKLKERVEKFTIGDVTDYDNWMGPVINEASFKKAMKYIEIGKKEGKLLIGGEGDDSEGYFIKPTVFIDIDSQSQMGQDEIFAPILAVIKAKDYDDAIRIANDTIYGLTGAVYTNNEEKIEKAIREFHVGNLYINRKCTAAFVGVHPFGGFNMSGTDSKTGAPGHLLLFMQMKMWSKKK